MSKPQRIGQLFMIGLRKDRLDAAEVDGIETYHFGSMTFTTHSSAGVAAIRAIADSVQSLATDDATDGVRFFIAANQEGGLIQGLSGTGFEVIPSAVDQGELDPATLRRMAQGWASELGEAGVNLDLAPVADVVPAGTESRNAPIGKLRREYGGVPAVVSSHVAAFIAGMQDGGIATSAKHFPGLGHVVGNTDFTDDVRDTVTTRDDPDMGPFAAAIDAGVPFVMVSLATYERIDPDHLAVFSPTVIDGMLRHDLAFGGVVISDALGATAVSSIPAGTRAVDFIAAGGDMIISKSAGPGDQDGQGARDPSGRRCDLRRSDRRRSAPRPRREGDRRPAALRLTSRPRTEGRPFVMAGTHHESVLSRRTLGGWPGAVDGGWLSPRDSIGDRNPTGRRPWSSPCVTPRPFASPEGPPSR